MEFEKFNSLTLIRESHEEEILRYSIAATGKRCVLTEKIHGSNFLVATDGSQVNFGRRGAYLEEGESFYGYQYVGELLEKKVKEMFNDLKEMVMEQHRVADLIEAEGMQANRPDIPRDFQELSIRGELAGGRYPADGVPEVKVGHGQVGKGTIWYSQDKSFYAFELCIDGVPQDFYTLGSLCSSYGIPLAPVLFFGTFDECLEYSREHLNDISVVPMMQPMLDADGKPILDGENFTHLPAILDNTREGHVIAPCEPAWFPNGKRMVFKHKGNKFMEDKGSKKPKSKPVLELSENQQTVYDMVLPLLTWERFEAVQSKHDTFSPKDFQKAMGLVVSDALDDAAHEDEFAEAWAALSTKERKGVTGPIGRECTLRLRSQFFN